MFSTSYFMILRNLLEKHLPDSTSNLFHTAKLSMGHGFTKGISVDVSYL